MSFFSLSNRFSFLLWKNSIHAQQFIRYITTEEKEEGGGTKSEQPRQSFHIQKSLDEVEKYAPCTHAPPRTYTSKYSKIDVQADKCTGFFCSAAGALLFVPPFSSSCVGEQEGNRLAANIPSRESEEYIMAVSQDNLLHRCNGK